MAIFWSGINLCKIVAKKVRQSPNYSPLIKSVTH